MFKHQSSQTVLLVLILTRVVFAQFSVLSIQNVNTSTRGYINNPVWSQNSKYLAFDFKATNSSSKIMVLNMDSGIKAMDLFPRAKSSSSLLVKVDDESMRLPQWSKIYPNTLYFLYSSDRSLLLSKVINVKMDKLPIQSSSRLPLDKTINQESNIAEYYPFVIEGEEYLFVKQQNSPGKISYTNQKGHLDKIYELSEVIEESELIDSFSFSWISNYLLLCKGQDNNKEIIIGTINADWAGIESVEFQSINVKKMPRSALQEPSFDPLSDERFAFLELSTDNNGMPIYELKIHSMSKNMSYLICHNLYRNEENKTSQPMSTSYAWYPKENFIFFIDKSSNRTISYANISSIESPVVHTLSDKLEYVENICISPNGQYLAAITSASSGKSDEDILSQIHLIKLKTN